MTAPQKFTLDRGVFNQTLYSRMRDFWFLGVKAQDSIAPESVTQRWYGKNEAFDNECRANFGAALEAIGPSRVTLPPFRSYDDDLDQADRIAGPFLQQVEEAQRDDYKKGTETLLSLILLLDQMPRNIYRDIDGLKLVYSHYDRLAWTLARSSMRMTPDPMLNEVYKHKPVFRQWFYLPLMHSEHLPSHLLYIETFKAWIADEKARGVGEETVAYIERSLKFEEMHLDPIQTFGRFPHRNECLERQHTPEEEEHLKTASSFGVKQGQSKNSEKSEL